MRKITAGAFLALSIGCGGVSQVDLDRIDAKIVKTAAETDRRITAMDTKYAKMLQLEQAVQNGLDRLSSGSERIDASAKLLDSANDRMIMILSAQKNALKEQLASVEAQLEALQKK